MHAGFLKYAQIRRQICVFHCIVHHTQGYSVQYAEVGCVFVRILNPCFKAARALNFFDRFVCRMLMDACM